MEPASRADNGSGSGGGLPARQAALSVLRQGRAARWSPRRGPEAMLAALPLTGRDRSLAHELVLGVVRHELTLRHVVAVVSGRDWRQISRAVQPILLLGAYQLIWLDGVPPFAAVDEAVEQAKACGAPAGRFVNALLRQIQRQIDHRRCAAAGADPSRAVPVDRATCCFFRIPVLPDPQHRPIEHVALATSHPVELVSRWGSAFGPDTTRQICLAGACRPPTILRPNPLRTDLASLAARLSADGIDVEPDAAGDMLVAPPGASVTRTAAFAAGLFQIQDRTAAQVVRHMGLVPGLTAIDLCAGPGTKATQMAECLNDRGTVLASDKDESRLAMVRDNCRRLGLTCVTTVAPGQREAAFAAQARIDWILVDAPCSNTGVLARRPEARYRVTARALASLTGLQMRLLAEADRIARPDTSLAYSTCSLEPEENERVVERFSRRFPHWRLRDSGRTFPSAGDRPADWRDGGFWAIWERGAGAGARSIDGPGRSTGR